MAFWGVEVKPGKPVIHSCEKARGRLRISQATLGISDATKKSIVQCNVGKKSPVLLCALLPNQTESCHLDLEFEEADDVVFSVIGPRGVYLTGYYVRQSQQSGAHSDSESYGVDIQNSQSEESSCRSDDDEYEDSFINDDDELEDFSPSPVSRSKVADETASENDDTPPNNGKGQRGRLKKNCQVVESSEDARSHDSEDEDRYLSSIFKNKKAEKTTSTGKEPTNVDQNITTNNVKDEKHSLDRLVSSDGARSHDSEDEDGYLLSIFKNKKAEKTTSTGKEATNVDQNITTNNEKDQMHSLDSEKPKKKRKARSQQEKTGEVEIGEGHSVLREGKRKEFEISKNIESDSGKYRKSKKRRKELQVEGTCTEDIDVKSEHVTKDDNLKHSLVHADSKKGVQAVIGDQEQKIDNDVSIKSELHDNASKPEKKTKKKSKKNKNQGYGEPEICLSDTAYNQERIPVKSENQTPNAVSTQNRTLSNGIIIEEVANGPPDGKVASRGKKVKIFYTAMLKENGHVYDSNVGKSPYKFRLGNEEVVDGWNLGIEGMHVGDKRRLIVPPSMGSLGKNGAGENVPPDSWLVYDVELAGVHK